MDKKRIFLILLMLLGVFIVPMHAVAAAHVVDGDTIDVNGIRYRLHGIDAPEAGQRCASANGGTWACGRSAIDKLKELVSAGDVQCDNRGRDDYDRVIAVCRVNDRDINSGMVELGLAWAFTKFSGDYVAVERRAKDRGIGVWQAFTQAPWEYRAEKWNVAIQIAPEGCPIKGNINRKKEKIYHTPWSRDYARTKVSLKRGERWFCSEREAIDAGFRAPLWGK